MRTLRVDVGGQSFNVQLRDGQVTEIAIPAGVLTADTTATVTALGPSGGHVTVVLSN